MSLTPISTHMSTASGRTQGRSKRQRSFALPDGREVHIALSPDEAARLRQRLKTIKDDGTFDVVIQSSPEHINYLKLAHSHHEERRRDLRTRHGEAYDEFERVKQELDALSVDLHMLSDHAVSLDANFSKFGYDAHLRTYDDPTESGAASLQGHDEDDHEHRDWDAERHKGRVFKLYKRPVVRQYFHRGLLWRASATTEVATFELFLDLLYVGIIAINGDRAAEDPTGYELQRYAITFIMSWRIWSDITVVIAWFEVDDILQRVSVLFIMACLIGLTTNMLQAFEQTYTQLVAFYLAARLFNAFYYVWIAYIIPMVRAMMIAQMLAILLPSVLWIASIFIEMPQRLVMIWVSLMLDLFATSVVIFLVRGSSRVSSRLAAWSDRVFEFYPAVNIEHKTERINAFVTLIFGYSVVALLYQNSASFGLNAFFGKAVLGLIQAFCLNTIYFEIDGSNLFQHAIRRHVITSLLWISVHLPFLLAFSLAGGALSKLVLAHDCSDADVENLTESYMAKSSGEVDVGLRWFYCGGLSIALACMGIISLCHIHKEVGGTRVKKSHRLINRFAVAIIILCLPLAHDLNSLYLVLTTMLLILWVLVLEFYGASCPKEQFWGEDKPCQYTAKCKISKKEMETAVKSGGIIRVSEWSDTGEKGLWEMS